MGVSLAQPADRIEERQYADLHQARQRVAHILPGLVVRTTFARRQGDRIGFFTVA